jgi:D-amino peptidase
MKRTLVLVALFMLFLAVNLCAEPPAKLKILISADMEGIGGVVTWDIQADSKGREYEKFRKLMTEEVNAAIQGALDAGATEIVVADSHGDGQNLDVELLNPVAKLIRSWPRPLLMAQGVDETFDAAVFIGYHASEGAVDGVLSHTMSSRRIYEIKLNGDTVPDAGFNAAVAGHFGVPVVFLSGDQTILAEARKLLGPIEGVEVKHALGRYSAETLHPQVVQEKIRAGVAAALRRKSDFKPYRLASPIKLQLSFKSSVHAELLAMLPGIERLDAHTIVFTARDMVEASKFLCVVMDYGMYQ